MYYLTLMYFKSYSSFAANFGAHRHSISSDILLDGEHDGPELHV